MKTSIFITLIMGLGTCLSSEAQRRVIPYHPDGASNIKVTLVNSNVRIVGYDGKDVIIEASRGSVAGAGAVRDTVIPGLDVSVRDGALIIGKQTEEEYFFVINVPQRTNLYYEEALRAPRQIEISGVQGRIEVSSWISKVVLRDVQGPLKVTCQAADISVRYSSLGPNGDALLVSEGRTVEVGLPAKGKADLDLQVLSGIVKSDFELGAASAQLLSRPGEVRRIQSRINGGGPRISIKASNITLLGRR